MPKEPILVYIYKLKRPIFTTFELCAMSGKSASAVTQALSNLAKHGLAIKIYRGVWALVGNSTPSLSLYSAIPRIFPNGRAYVSFISALHLYGIIEQIPQLVTVASTSHTRVITTKLGVISVHRLTPNFFTGFDWYRQKGDFLIAEPEKALVDSLYLSACKKRQFAYFPELHFPRSFSFKKARMWAGHIPSLTIRANAQKKLETITR